MLETVAIVLICVIILLFAGAMFRRWVKDTTGK